MTFYLWTRQPENKGELELLYFGFSGRTKTLNTQELKEEEEEETHIQNI
jgi:transposase